jgi:hypothetical protein
MYISIGNACNMKYQINKFKKKKETLFFDWLMTDMNSVNMILNPDTNINNLLNIDNLIIKPYYNNKSQIIVKSLSRCVSIHDVKINPSIDYINTNFIEKYKRRYYRLINYIKNNKKIYFCRFGIITNDEKTKFIETIKNINPQCKFVLVNIIEENNENTKCLIEKEENFLKITSYYKDKKTNLKIPEWTTSYLNWKEIFETIENNI